MYTVYTLATEYTTIRVKKKTKELLEKTLVSMESRLGRRLDYDTLLRLLAKKTLRGKPWLLEWLLNNPVSHHDTAKAQEILRLERRRDERSLAGRQGSA